MEIVFTKVLDFVSDHYRPVPSSKVLPEWYKKTPSTIDDINIYKMGGPTSLTIKKCIPVFDSLTSGYIIPTYSDLYISKNNLGEIEYRVSNNSFIEFHSTAQAPYAPYMNKNPYPKWINPWSISTPKGYSCLFINPVHKANNYFSILEGVVDTDFYRSPVNFPFVLNDIDFEGVIPAGTPMVQVIPFKRDEWTMKIGDEKYLKKSIDDNFKLSSKFLDRYKNLFWNRKSFK